MGHASSFLQQERGEQGEQQQEEGKEGQQQRKMGEGQQQQQLILPRPVGLPPSLRLSPASLHMDALPLSLADYASNETLLRRLEEMTVADGAYIYRTFVQR